MSRNQLVEVAQQVVQVVQEAGLLGSPNAFRMPQGSSQHGAFSQPPDGWLEWEQLREGLPEIGDAITHAERLASRRHRSRALQRVATSDGPWDFGGVARNTLRRRRWHPTPEHNVRADYCHFVRLPTCQLLSFAVAHVLATSGDKFSSRICDIARRVPSTTLRVTLTTDNRHEYLPTVSWGVVSHTTPNKRVFFVPVWLNCLFLSECRHRCGKSVTR